MIKPVPKKPGDKYGRLTILTKINTNISNRFYWKCLCDCGVIKNISDANLGRGTNSCGCLRIEFCKNKTMSIENNIRSATNCVYRRNARNRNLAYDIDITLLWVLITSPCLYCGSPPSLVAKTSGGRSMLIGGIDRLDSSIGYSIENCVPCCKMCNSAKGNMTLLEFSTYIYRLIQSRIVI